MTAFEDSVCLCYHETHHSVLLSPDADFCTKLVLKPPSSKSAYIGQRLKKVFRIFSTKKKKNVPFKTVITTSDNLQQLSHKYPL